MMLRQAQSSEPRAFPRFAPVRLRTVSRANPPFVRNLPPHARASARFYKENLHRYGNTASSGSVVANDPVDHTDYTGLKCNADRTACTADADPSHTSGPTVANSPATDKAMHDAKGSVQVKSGDQEKIGFIEKDGSFRKPGDAKTGSTDTQDNARAGSRPNDAGVIHGHTPGDNGMVDDTQGGRGPGDSQPLKHGLTNGTVTPDGRLGVHEEVSGRVQFRMIDGHMTRSEAHDIQSNLDDEQRLMDK